MSVPSFVHTASSFLRLSASRLFPRPAHPQLRPYLPSHPRTTPLRRHPHRQLTVSSATPTPPTPTSVRARHILVDSEEMVDALREQLSEKASDKTFADLAKLVSTCPSKERGGDLGWFKRNVMVPEFENAAFSNPPGSLLKIRTQFGWHLILVEQHGVAPAPISVDEFSQRFPNVDAQDEAQLIDVREPDELQLASLPGFLNLPMSQYEDWAPAFENGDYQLLKEKETIVMCHHGVRSANFCQFLSQQGFSNVRNLVGGIDAYSKQVDSSIPTY